jgi:hypothetical protein
MCKAVSFGLIKIIIRCAIKNGNTAGKVNSDLAAFSFSGRNIFNMPTRIAIIFPFPI